MQENADLNRSNIQILKFGKLQVEKIESTEGDVKEWSWMGRLGIIYIA